MRATPRTLERKEPISITFRPCWGTAPARPPRSTPTWAHATCKASRIPWTTSIHL